MHSIVEQEGGDDEDINRADSLVYMSYMDGIHFVDVGMMLSDEPSDLAKLKYER